MEYVKCVSALPEAVTMLIEDLSMTRKVHKCLKYFSPAQQNLLSYGFKL